MKHQNKNSSSDKQEALLLKSLKNSELVTDGKYTNPRTWGTYDICDNSKKSNRFRFGNHPVRMNELNRKYNTCHIVAIFSSRELACELANLLNSNIK
jgi:hypothetical protein